MSYNIRESETGLDEKKREKEIDTKGSRLKGTYRRSGAIEKKKWMWFCN